MPCVQDLEEIGVEVEASLRGPPELGRSLRNGVAPQLPHTCSARYVEKWPTSVRWSHADLRRQRRGKFWQRIIARPGDDDCPADSDFQWSEYECGYALGFREDCQDAEWFKTWLVYRAHERQCVNTANSFLLGYIHGQHLRRTGVRCRADLTSLPTESASPRNFEELPQVARPGVRRSPRPLMERDSEALLVD